MQKIILEESEFSFLESCEIEKIRLNLRLSDEINKKSILITSSVEQEGKTSVALKLGCAMADAGDKVLFVNLNCTKIFNHEITPNVIYNTTIEKLDMISINNTADWQQYGESYQYILIDAPAMSVCKYNIAIADTCDVILLVIEANRLGYQKILESIEELSIGSHKDIRVVLNRTKKAYGIFKKRVKR